MKLRLAKASQLSWSLAWLSLAKTMSFLVATNAPERRPTGTLHARAKIKQKLRLIFLWTPCSVELHFSLEVHFALKVHFLEKLYFGLEIDLKAPKLSFKLKEHFVLKVHLAP